MKKGRAAAAVATASGSPSANGQTPKFVDALGDAAITNVPIGDINLEDKATQFRVTTRTDNLRGAIERDGQLHPVALFGSKPYRIIDGFRRVQAIKELGWPTVKAVVHAGITEDEAFRRAFASNAQRKNFSALDRAKAIHHAKQRGMKHPEIAEAFGMSERQVERYERLLTFPKPIQGLLADGEFTMAHAVVLAKFDGIRLVDWVQKLQDNHWSATELGRELRKTVAKRASKSSPCVRIEGDACRVYARRFSAKTPPKERARAAEEYERLAVVLRRDLPREMAGRSLELNAPARRERDESGPVRAGTGEKQRSRRRDAKRPRMAAAPMSSRRGRNGT